jgi:hypothetical protein
VLHMHVCGGVRSHCHQRHVVIQTEKKTLGLSPQAKYMTERTMLVAEVSVIRFKIVSDIRICV